MRQNGSVWSAAFLLVLIACAQCSGDQDLCDRLGSDVCPARGRIEVRRPDVESVTTELGELIKLQQEQLDRMKNMVDSLADSVQAMRDAIAASRDCSAVASEERDFGHRNAEISLQESVPSSASFQDPSIISPAAPTIAPERPPRAKGRVIARYKPTWSEHFQFLSAVRLDAPLSCLHILPHEGDDGMAKYVAVGDEAGHLYIVSSLGDLLVDHASVCTAPVTVMISVVLRRNETILVTGHSNGAVLAHRVWESSHRSSSLVEDGTSLRIEYSHSFQGGGEQGKNAVISLEMYRVGRMRYLLVADSTGRIQVFRDNGTLYGTAESPSKPLAFLRTSSTQRLLFLTASGAASLDLRTMTVRSSPCEGLQNSSLVAYAFDASGRSKAYGVADNGELVYVALSGDTLHFDCQARAKRKLDLQGPVKLHGLRGYILAATPREVAVYNSTGFSTGTRGGRALVTASMDEISQAFLETPVAPPAKQAFLAGDRDKMVVLGFGDGYVGIFRSNLPIHRPSENGGKVWGGPFLFSMALLSLAWFFFSRKRDRMKEDVMGSAGSFAAAASAATAATGAGFGAAASTNSSETLRKYDRSGLEEPRRFASRGVYGGGKSGATFGIGSVNFRSTAVEHAPPY